MFQKYFMLIRVLLKVVLSQKCVKYYNFIKYWIHLHIGNKFSILLLQLKIILYGYRQDIYRQDTYS